MRQEAHGMRQIWNTLIDRPPITEGWHLLVLLGAGVVVVALLHRQIRLRIARAARHSNRSDPHSL